MGHIDLCVPVYNPTLLNLLYKTLRLKCFACHHLRCTGTQARVLVAKLMLLDCGKLAEAVDLDRLLLPPEGRGQRKGLQPQSVSGGQRPQVGGREGEG